MTALENSSSDKNIEIIKKVYSGMNQNDIDAVMSLLDTNVIRIEPEFLSAATYRGHVELRNHISSGRNTWAEGACEPVEFFSKANKVVVIVHIKVQAWRSLPMVYSF